MTYILTCILLLTSVEVQCQKLFFPHNAFTGVSSMESAIQPLAEKVIARFTEGSPKKNINYYASLFRYQVLAHQWKPALNSIDSARNLFDPAAVEERETYVYPFWLFATAELENVKLNIPFEITFDTLFTRSYSGFSIKAIDKAENYFKSDLSSRQARYLEMAARLTHNTVDSISYNDAKTLCFNFLNYLVYTAEIPRVSSLMLSVNKRKYIIQDSVMITLRDGSKVSATVVRGKNAAGPLPVIFKFGIYAEKSEVPEVRFIASHGYAAVIADTRGKRLSTSEIVPFEHDANDAYDIIDWISHQEWCNGKVGMYGGSYLGFTTWASTKKLHPALKTIVPQAAVGVGVDIPGMYGIAWTGMLDWLHLVTNTRLTDWSRSGNKKEWNKVRDEWYKSGKAINSLDTLEGRPNALFQRYLAHPEMDKFWQNTIPSGKEFSRINIPVLTITGYYDDDQRGAMYYFDMHHRFNKNAKHYLLIGPYDHGGAQGYPLDPPSEINNYTIDNAARIKIIDIVFGWFDHILKNGPQPDLLSSAINFEVMGSDKWRHVGSLKEMNNDTITFYLTGKSSGNRFVLQQEAPGNKGFVPLEVDLSQRLPVDDEETVLNGNGNIVDTTLVTRNSLCFITDAVKNSFDINGSFVADIYASLNKRDMDLSMRLYELQKDGQYFQLSNNIARCSYLKDLTKRELLTPDKVEHLFFSNTFFTSRHIEAGSRLVLLLGVNNSPEWEVNYGTGGDVARESVKDTGEPLKIHWITGNSCIRLPVWK